jgi:exopolyphosphatase/guanosine-5'-triphosphate,3'-diphosphate pyrophosphatase
MIRASIDIGSNSVLLLACEFTDKIESEILNLSHITSLGRDLDKTGMFCKESMDLTYKALEHYRDELIKINFNPKNTIVTATEAARVAKNSKTFFDLVKENLGFEIKIITGEQEAYFTAMGVASGTSKGLATCTIMDIGGASTEFIKLQMNPLKVLTSISLPVGSVRATDWNKEKVLDLKMKNILDNDLSVYQTETLVCVAGSMTSLASMFLGKKIFNDKEIDGLVINFNEFVKFADDLQGVNKEELLLNFPFLGKRAEMVAAGARVAKMLGEKIKIKKIQISTRGLRYGVLVNGGINGNE